MDWHRDGADWPNRACSFFVIAGDLTWHVQRMGRGPLILLAHGTGSATHTWRDLMPVLAQNFTVVAADLPGHGFTEAPPGHGMNLPEMAAALGHLVAALEIAPELAIGHSAGAAVLARLALDGGIAPAALISLNGAFLPIPGMTGELYSGLAKWLALVPGAPWLLSWHASNRDAVRDMAAHGGSTLDERGIDLYARLLSDHARMASIISMMAHWDLEPLAKALPALATKLVLIAAENDLAVPLKVAYKVQALVTNSELIVQPGLGHLSHEEAPAETAALIAGVAQRQLGNGAFFF